MIYQTIYKNIYIYIYNFDDNEHNKRLYNDVLNELNKNRIIKFIEYNIFIDNKKILHYEHKVSRIYLMDY